MDPRQPPFTVMAAKYPATDEIRIYVGSNRQSWDVARLRNAYGPAVLLPPGEDFNKYKWPVKGREVLVLLLGEFPEEQEFAAHLVNEGAPVVRVLNGGRMDSYRPAA